MASRSLKRKERWLAAEKRAVRIVSYEVYWQQIQPFLASRRYALRPRYHPDWIPSWRLTGEYPPGCEDSVYSLTFGRVMDAFRIADGKRVALKKVKKDAYGVDELATMKYLSSEPLRSDPRNRCVRLLDVLDPGDCSEHFLIVTPLLHFLQHPTFLMVGEAMEFCRQILEGLVFLHEHNVEHRDCCTGNIMMDGEPLYPKGRHPVFEEWSPDFRGRSHPLRRADIAINYYFIDFGHSTRFDSYESRRPLVARRGQDKTAPELESGAATDGFKLDIYCIGNMIREELIEVYPQLAKTLLPLTSGMTQPVPDERPTATQALAWFREIHQQMPSRQLAARLVHQEEGVIERVIRGCIFLAGNLRRVLWRNQAAQSANFSKYAHIPYRLPEDPVGYDEMAKSMVSADGEDGDGWS